jgi:hypothetical protein
LKTTTTWKEFLPLFSSRLLLKYFRLTVVALLLFSFKAGAQIDAPLPPSDQPVIQRPHSIRKAVLYSAVLPGLGQFYNKKYWKIPIVYAALGATGYFVMENHKQYQYYYQGLEKLILTGEDIFEGRFTEDNLIFISNTYRRWRDLSIILFVAAYGLNILDAYVDAHFFHFDISDDLSMKVQPTIQNHYLGIYAGLHFTINFEASSKRQLPKNFSF